MSEAAAPCSGSLLGPSEGPRPFFCPAVPYLLATRPPLGLLAARGDAGPVSAALIICSQRSEDPREPAEPSEAAPTVMWD